MKVADIRKMKTDELTTTSVKINEEITELRRRTRMGEVANVRAVRAKRKDLARIYTVLTEQLSKENA